jgi:hypothetical protein
MGIVMKRNAALKILNPILLVLFISQTITALFHDEISYKVFQIFHKGGGFVLLAFIAAHFVLNFNWVKANYLTRHTS